MDQSRALSTKLPLLFVTLIYVTNAKAIETYCRDRAMLCPRVERRCCTNRVANGGNELKDEVEFLRFLSTNKRKGIYGCQKVITEFATGRIITRL